MGNIFIALRCSNINGLVSVVNRKISSFTKVESGIGGVAIAMLYKSLPEIDYRKHERDISFK